MQTLAEHGMLDSGLRMRSMVLPDVFLDHDSPTASMPRRARRQGHRHQGVRSPRKDFSSETVKLA